MSTRATYKFHAKRSFDSDITLYIHHDGYPKGAAEYIQNWLGNFTEDSPHLTVEKFIRTNEHAEITPNHESHDDTQYRYDFIYYPDGWHVEVSGHDLESGEWSKSFSGLLDRFVTEQLGSTWLKNENSSLTVEKLIVDQHKQDAEEDRHEEEKLEHRYEIYVECMNCCASPQDIKSFDEWLDS